MGGSGKTPFVMYLAELLFEQGDRPGIVSRGYKGRYKGPYLVVSDGRSPGPLTESVQCGDEPYLMASRMPHVPVVTARRRIDGVRATWELHGTTVALLDDGFQHLALHRDLDIVLITGREDAMFPSGMLREPFCALQRADMIVLAGENALMPEPCQPYVKGKPTFRYVAQPTQLIGNSRFSSPTDLAGAEVILVSGIAAPERFGRAARSLGWNVRRHHVFPDHHAYNVAELSSVLGRNPGVSIIFTEKDWVRLPREIAESDNTAALRIDIELDDESGFIEALRARLEIAYD